MTPAPKAGAGAALVEFRASGLRIQWDSEAHSLLDFAEAQGLTPVFSCRMGICATCASPLLSGEVDYFEEPLDPPPPGAVLLCCARPRGSIVIDI